MSKDITKPRPSRDAEIDAVTRTALYMDDFVDLETWKYVCKCFRVSEKADQIFFKAAKVTYCLGEVAE